MHISQSLSDDQQRVEIRVSGTLTAEAACAVLPYAATEAATESCREFVLDLREALVPHAVTLFRLPALLQTFKPLVQERDLRVTVVRTTGDREQWLCLDRAAACSGINLQYFSSRQAALQFAGASAAGPAVIQ